MTNNQLITQSDLDDKLNATDAAANTSVSRIYTALGHMLEHINVALDIDPDLRGNLEEHLIVIDEETRSLKDTVLALTQEMTQLASFAQELLKQRNDAMRELKDANDRVQDIEATALSNLYNDQLSNIQVHFNCSRKVANKLLDAIWDIEEPIASLTAEMLDSMARTLADVVDQR